MSIATRLPVGANFDAINQNSGENCTMRLLDTLILGKYLTARIRANTNTVNQNSRKNYIIGLLDVSILEG